MMKTCHRCGTVKVFEDYYREAKRADGRAATCKACHSKRRREKLTDTLAREVTSEVRADFMAAILPLVDEDEKTGCWKAWKTEPNGYARLSYGGIFWWAHRASLHYLGGGLRSAEVSHHLCGVRSCLNPEHLQAVSQPQNQAERLALDHHKEELDVLHHELDQARKIITGLERELDQLRSTP